MFSIVIPYYKKRNYIERCLDAVLEQTCQNFEIILVDDGSQDDIAKLISQKYPQVKLIQQNNQGVSAARNTGIANAKHEYIAFLDADDYWSPFYLEKVTEVINNEQEIKIIGTNYTRVKSKLETENPKLDYFLIKNYFKKALRLTYFFTSGTVLLREFFQKENGFNPILKSGEDIDVWFRAVLSGGNAFYIKNTLVYYSDEDENQATITSKNFSNRFIANANAIYFQHGKKIYPQYFYDFLSKYMYSSLYVMYFQKATHEDAKKIKNTISEKYFFVDLYYGLPYIIGEVIFANSKIRKLARKYFKFIFTYIHNK